MRAVFVAAAVDDTALLAGRRRRIDAAVRGTAPGDVQSRRRGAAALSPHLERRRGPEALGFAGPACLGGLGPEGTKLELLNLSCEVGRRHDRIATWRPAVSAPGWRSTRSSRGPEQK